MRGKINELLFIKGTVVLPFFFRKKISTKQNIASTEIAHQFSAPKVPVSIARGEIKPPTPVLQPIYFSCNEKPSLWQFIQAC